MTESEQRHFEVVLEQILHEVKTVAEGHGALDGKIGRFHKEAGKDHRPAMDLIKFSHDELNHKIEGVEHRLDANIDNVHEDLKETREEVKEIKCDLKETREEMSAGFKALRDKHQMNSRLLVSLNGILIQTLKSPCISSNPSSSSTSTAARRARMVAAPGDWIRSSYIATCEAPIRGSWLSVAAVQSLFGGAVREAITHYRKFVLDGIAADSPMKQLRGQIYRGGDDFSQELNSRLGEKKLGRDIICDQQHLARPQVLKKYEV